MRTTTIAAAALLLLALTGCTGTTETTPSETPAAVATVEPLVAEEPAAAPEGGDEAAFLEEVRERLPATTIIPNATDEQLLVAGWEACERREAGEPGEDISVIEGEERSEYGIFLDSQAIVSSARHNLCPVG